MDLREETPEDMAHRMLKFLSVLKYSPACSVQEFQVGIFAIVNLPVLSFSIYLEIVLCFGVTVNDDESSVHHR